ncbi:hypothetical protein AKJ65_00440 [candidate division MSBL1 archaeon SCGC-AAA259E19]|uniref:HTH asnC-type domain-containing protein n=3 Tax=candidate division MSBL1 TaxID=215777 RepID=A0A133V5V0_9EURY|nr:hypothetical protein AKJ64_04255 [candidate division MSBL1 archaeon SCGC-AAA259E17]KXA95816.1 hypothetical protein AKJ65_00440 [candidate division MSBL1 archaeon SCGC-AAA259E19]KXB01766.1 hypothetical protein AKJ41_00275 [candidate division MSBL1 archaeon SCGC-AAA259O05]
MNDLDKKILLELLRDADQPMVDIAEKVDASRQTVSKKIKKFKESELIKDLKVKIDPEKIGLKVRAFVFLQEAPQEEVRERIEKEISKMPNVSKFFRLFGRYSGILEVWSGGREDLSSLVKKIHELEGIKETETFIVHDVLKNRPENPLIEFLGDE